MPLKGKTAFITGAARGQGRATALALAREGVNIAAFDIAQQIEYPPYNMATPNELLSLSDTVKLIGASCLTLTGDVRSANDVSEAVCKTIDFFGHIDILFNNAGICAYGWSYELTEAEWDAMLDINLKGAWLTGKHIIPHMIRQRQGVIINNSSVLGMRGAKRLSHYVASKWALRGLTKSWAIELAPYNIRCVSIHPTGVNTPMNDGLAQLENASPEEIAERSAGNLLNVPWVDAEDIAQAVVFLASDQARYITGSEMIIDAGLLTK